MNCRTWICRSILTAGLAALLTTGAAAASYGTGVVDADGLRIRSEPNTDSNVVVMVYQGGQVDVLEAEKDGWYKVEYNGKVGYMSADFLVVTPAVSEAPPAAPETAAQDGAAPAVQDEEVPAVQSEEAPTALGNGKVALSSGTLNLRSAPSTESSRLASIPNGTVLTLDAEEDGWYKVVFSGITGYVSGDYIVKTDEEPFTPSYSSETGLALVELAKKYLGCPYVFGATGPKSFDCSGFTYYVFKQMGYSIPRGGSGQFYHGTSVTKSELQPGDLVFFRDPATAGSYPMTHVGIYIGNNQFIHASSSKRGSGVKISSLSETWYANIYAGGRRIL